MISKIGPTAEQLSASIQTNTKQMEQNQHLGNYSQAEKFRLIIQQLKKDYEARRLYDMEQKHRNQVSQLAKAHEQELEHFHKFWDKKLNELASEGHRFESEMMQRHQQQIIASREDFEKQISLKFKQSSQLLNLRKMEEHMAKQKKYVLEEFSFVEAQKVKDRCVQLQKQEKQQYTHSRNLKIETNLNKIRHKQESELNALDKRIKTSLDEQNKERGIEESRLKQKYTNISKDLRMQQQKQIMAYKGQFRSKGGPSSPLTNKSKTGSFK